MTNGCPNCSHTMASMGYANGGTIWHCPRCGTVKHFDQFVDAPPKVYTPSLILSCRMFQGLMSGGASPEELAAWKRIGIAESINRPEDRK